MIDNFNIEYLHESSETIWSIAMEITREEKLIFLNSNQDELIKLGFMYVCTIKERRQNLNIVDTLNEALDDI